MIESRCGIKCSECEFKKSIGCAGCINIEKPFWNDICPVKLCCEQKRYQHCGECETFPCKLANDFAFDEKQGDNGKRLVQCNLWRRKDDGK